MVYKKYESIKLNIISGRELKAFPTARVIQDHEDRIKALEGALANNDNTGGTGSNTGTEGNTGGDSGNSEPQISRTLSFTINDGTDPVEGATVSMMEGVKTGTTGSAGGCTIASIGDGEYAVEVSATGYTTKTETISVDETHTSFTISLVAIPVYDVTLTVTDGTNAIEGASVVIGETTKTTDSNGECTFDDLEADTYSAEISKEGYTTKTESISVDETHTIFTISLTSA